MDELINTTKTYCKICHRFVGYRQKDRRTLLAPVTICHACELQAKAKQVIWSDNINTACIIALIVAGIASGLLVLHHIVRL